MFMFHTALAQAFPASQLPVAAPFLQLCWARLLCELLKQNEPGKLAQRVPMGYYQPPWLILPEYPMAQALVQPAAAADQQ